MLGNQLVQLTVDPKEHHGLLLPYDIGHHTGVGCCTGEVLHEDVVCTLLGIILLGHHRIGCLIEQDMYRTIGVAQHLSIGNGCTQIGRQRLVRIDTIRLESIFVIGLRIVGRKTKSIRTQTDG